MEIVPIWLALSVWAIAGICPDPIPWRRPRGGGGGTGGGAGFDPSDPWGPNPGPDDGPRPPGPWPWKLVGGLAGMITGFVVTRLVPGFEQAPFTNLALSAGLAYLGGSFAQQVAVSVAGAGAPRQVAAPVQGRAA